MSTLASARQVARAADKPLPPTSLDRPEFEWPPRMDTYEVFDFKTQQIVSPFTLVRDPLPPAAEAPLLPAAAVPLRPAVEVPLRPAARVPLRPAADVPLARVYRNAARPDGWRDKRWRVVAVLAVLVVIATAYLAVRFVKEKGRGTAASDASASPALVNREAPQPNALAPVASSTSAPSAVAPSATVPQAPVPAAGPVHGDANRTSNRSAVTPAGTRVQRAPIAVPAEPGWFSLSLPIDVQLFDSGHFIGTLDAGRVRLPAGLHELELVNRSVHFRERRSVEIKSGSVTPLSIVVPTGRLQVNAVPWGEVLIDGKRVGDTPLGELHLSIGPHRVAFRHPRFGEQARTVLIVAGESTRLGVDLRR